MNVSVWTDPFGHEIVGELEIEAAKRFRRYQLPESAEEWRAMRPKLREKLSTALNLRIDHDLPLDPHWGPERPFQGYTAQSVWFQSRKDCYMTGTLYKPQGKGPFPGVVFVHGHNSNGRLAPVNQAHGHVFARHGYVTLFVDAFGSGERATCHGSFDYHGGLTGGGLLAIGEPLMGLQIMDNMRAVDLLVSLDCVDARHIGATGASGGGNQTMYLAAFDERIQAACPVVSVGSYQSYIGGANCVCELLPGGMDICEESSLLALVAPRALMPCNALHDINKTFFVPEMMRSYTEVKKVFTALGVPEKLDALAFKGPHSYPAKVESAVLGFFNCYLKESGDSREIQAGEGLVEPVENVMCFPAGKRDPQVPSIIEYIRQKAGQLARNAHGTPEELARVLRVADEQFTAHYLSTEQGWQKYTIETSRGRLLPFLFRPGRPGVCRILAAPQGKKELNEAGLIDQAAASGDSVLVFDPWGAGECGYATEIQNIWIEQHQLARSLIWFNRTLMGEWTMDYMAAFAFVRGKLPGARLLVTGLRDSGLAALYAAVLKGDGAMRIELIHAPASLVRVDSKKNGPVIRSCARFDYVAPEYFTMALSIPGILVWGDVAHAVALAPCEVVQTEAIPDDGRLA